MEREPRHDATRCRSCASDLPAPFLRVDDVPVLVNELWPDPTSAVAAARGDVLLALCPRCGLVSNVAFDPSRVVYTNAYETSLHWSATFRAYATELAATLVDRYDLHDATVVEVGAGRGEFLSLLCDIGGNDGIAYEPSYERERQTAVGGHVLRFVSSLDRVRDGAPPDLVVTRHVLEHVPDPRSFVADLRDLCAPRSAPLFVEVPAGLTMLRDEMVFDVIYEHCSYFTAPALARILSDTGLGVTSLHRSYGDQNLCALARPGEPSAEDLQIDVAPPDLPATAACFARSFDRLVGYWSDTLDDLAADGREAVLWGAGSKGVTFCNVVPGARHVERIVDVNPRKQGLHVPGTAQRVVSPEDLRDDPPDVVVVMNPVYAREVGCRLDELGLRARLLTARDTGALRR